jgi:hypothetical protein
MFEVIIFDSISHIRDGVLTRFIYFIKPVYFKEVATIFKQWKNAGNSVYQFMASVNRQENPEGLTDVFSPF